MSEARGRERPVTVAVEDVHVRYRVPSAEDTGSSRRALVGRATGRTSWAVVRALQGVSFVARQGETIGVLGRNGSGKSTLMRAIAGLTTPTDGRVLARSRPVLLGVNAALLPDLPGSRNVVLGGLALGLSRREVDERYDDIVELADLGDAIHLPMRTYSSGMQARLRFAIATATRPRVLLVDEALNTGDADFKQRSRERIDELRAGAGTVFIVSHSLATILETCTRALWLDGGRLRMDGEPRRVTRAYRAHVNALKRARVQGLPPPVPPWETPPDRGTPADAAVELRGTRRPSAVPSLWAPARGEDSGHGR